MVEKTSESLPPEYAVRAVLEEYIAAESVERVLDAPVNKRDGKSLRELAAEDPEAALKLTRMMFCWRDVQK